MQLIGPNSKVFLEAAKIEVKIIPTGDKEPAFSGQHGGPLGRMWVLTEPRRTPASEGRVRRRGPGSPRGA